MANRIKTQFIKHQKQWSAYTTVKGLDLQEYGDTQKEAREKLEARIKKGTKSLIQISFDLFEKRLADARNVLDIQGSDGNWNANEYLFGMFNGMELIVSIFEGREPKYRDKPTEWGKSKAATVDGKQLTPEELTENFLHTIMGREDIFPKVLEILNYRMLWKLRHDSEIMAERTMHAKKRLEEGLLALRNAMEKG